MFRGSTAPAVALAVAVAGGGWYVAVQLRQSRHPSIGTVEPRPAGGNVPRPTATKTEKAALNAPPSTGNTPAELTKSDADWKKSLTPQQFEVLRNHGTERAFTGDYWNTKQPGIYCCAGCGEPLFDAATKFDSGTGWPSFTAPVDGVESRAVGRTVDRSMIYETRVEVHCNRCGGHLGHVFSDGPAPTGLRYCINSCSLKLDARSDAQPAAEKKATRQP